MDGPVMDGHGFPLGRRHVGRGREHAASLKKKLSVMLSFYAGNSASKTSPVTEVADVPSSATRSVEVG
jgi:hypothetical protein